MCRSRVLELLTVVIYLSGMMRSLRRVLVSDGGKEKYGRGISMEM